MSIAPDFHARATQARLTDRQAQHLLQLARVWLDTDRQVVEIGTARDVTRKLFTTTWGDRHATRLLNLLAELGYVKSAELRTGTTWFISEAGMRAARSLAEARS